MLDAIRKRLADAGKQATPVAPPVQPNIDGRDVLSELDLIAQADEEGTTKTSWRKWQGRLSELVRDPRFKERSLICVFEGVGRRRQGRQHPPHHRGDGRARNTRSCRSPRRPRKSAPSPICGASGGTCRAPAA